jgi:Fic family protein
LVKKKFISKPHRRIGLKKKWKSFSHGGMKAWVEGLLRAGIAHFYFITIHPFEDGNGRIARALTDMALAQDEKLSIRFYSLANRIMTEREKYYDVLEQTQKGTGDITDWLLWFPACMERAIEYSETLLNTVLTKTNSWQKYADVELSRNQRKVINRLLDAGPSGFEGGLTTRKYVSMTKVSRATAYREILDMVTRGILNLMKEKAEILVITW